MKDALARRCGVTDVKVDIQSNWVTIRPDASRFLQLGEVGPAVRRAGYVPTDMSIKAVGTFERNETGMRFRIRGWPQTFPIIGADQASGEQEIRAKWIDDAGHGRLELISP